MPEGAQDMNGEDGGFVVRPVGRVASPLTDPAAAPMQGYEGAPDAWLVLDPAVGDALHGLRAGDQVLMLTWLDRASRTVLQVHPRDDPATPLHGVFATRSQDRPNPIGLHQVQIRTIEGLRVLVGPLEAVDGTPVLDIKPVLDAPGAT